MIVGSNDQVLKNPTDSQRHSILMNALKRAGRLEDYENIIKILSPLPDITNYGSPGEYKKVKVGIIGGGLAGLSSAFELRKLGFDITLFEASDDRIGGRVYTCYFDKDKGLYGEFGAMRIPVSHEITWHYINLFKLNTNLFIQSSPNSFVYVRKTRTKNIPSEIMNKIYPQFRLTPAEKNTQWPELFNQISRNILLSLPPEIRAEIIRVQQQYSPQYLYYANRSIRRILELAGLSEGAIALITNVMPIIGAFPYHSYGEIMHDDYTVDFISPFQIDGGTVNLPLSFYKSLISNNPKEYGYINQDALGKIDFRGGCWVNGIFKSDSNGKIILRTGSKNTRQHSYESFDYVICAIPFSVLRVVDINPVFSNEKMQAIKEIDYVDAQKTLFLCSQRFWEKGDESQKIVGGASYTDLPIESIVYPSQHGDGFNNPSAPGVLVASYNLGQDAVRIGSIEEPLRFEVIKREVEEVQGLPRGYLDNIVQGHKTVNWNNEPWAKGAFDIFYPGQKKVFLYEMLRPEYGGRIFFAGEHTSRKHAWMQGALYSGMLAANMLVSHAKNNIFMPNK